MGFPSARRITTRAGSFSFTVKALGLDTRSLLVVPMGSDCALSLCEL
jgi:hypothetical protein